MNIANVGVNIEPKSIYFDKLRNELAWNNIRDSIWK